ncbi:MAG: Mut7-C RNAse domain-containing protein [Candidatus Lokiarchaeota archaeon]|nr:Mut7-C RNAse domain-containing protein [Candidatus Lokiarchaeota archaeon]
MTEEVTFLCDAMVGKLARLLRIFGFDTIYAEQVEPSAPDSKLLEFALKSNRIILTRDLPFFKRAGKSCIYLEELDPYKNLIYLKEMLGLKLDFSIEKARCSACNSLLKKILKKDAIKDIIKPETYRSYNEFFTCSNPNCNKIYWKGSHIEKIKIHLSDMED